MTEPWQEWSWYTGPLAHDHKCAECYQPLRLHGQAGIVSWRDRRVYAVQCLLTKLAKAPPGGIAAAPAADAANPFGILGLVP